MKRSHAILILFLTFVILILSKSCWAQEVAISVKPAVNIITTKPGKTIYQTIHLYNSGDPQVYILRLYKLDVADRYGNFKISSYKDIPVDVVITAPYIRLDKPFLMQGQTQEDLPVRIDIPEDISGEYQFTIVAESDKPLPVEGSVNTRISGGLGSIFFLRVIAENTDEKKIETVLFQALTQVSIPLFNSRLAFVDSNHSIPFVLTLKNKGSHTVVPQGELMIKNITNKKTNKYPIVPVYLYPDKDRLIPLVGYQLQECVKKYGQNSCSKDYSYVHQGFGFGLFEASTKITFGSDSPTLYSRDFFIVFPFILFWILGFGTILVIVLLIVLWKRHLQQAKKPLRHSQHIL